MHIKHITTWLLQSISIQDKACIKYDDEQQSEEDKINNYMSS